MNLFKQNQLSSHFHTIKKAILGVLFGLLFPLISYFFLDNKIVLFAIICSAPVFLGIFSAWIGMKQDQTEEKVKWRTREIQKQKEYLDTTVIVSETDLNGNIVHVNENFCITSGYSLDELKGKPHSLINSGVHRREFWEDYWNTISKGQIWSGQICNRKSNGDIYWIESIVNPNMDDDGNIIGFSSVGIDVTNQKETEKQLLHASKLATVGELAAGVGHEINNPLSIAVGNIALVKKYLKEKDLIDEKVLHFIENIELSNRRISRIADGLRTYARSDSDFLKDTSIKEAIHQTVNMVSEIYENEGLRINLQLSDEDLYTKGTIGALQQILLNLLTNARDASRDSKIKQIDIKLCKEDSKMATIIIKDYGTGIPEKIIDKIFQPFFTTKETGSGTGLGLGLIHEMVKKMNGEIEVSSKLGEGSIFAIYLPLCTPPTPIGETCPLSTDQVQMRGTALVVDDEAGIRALLINHLEDLGLAVESAENGAEALEMVLKKHYDYICTDIQMPKMNGDEFIREAKKRSPLRSKYFIITGGVTSDYSMAKDENSAPLADGFIKKPFSEDDIFKTLSNSGERFE